MRYLNKFLKNNNLQLIYAKPAKHISQSPNNVEFSKFASEKFSDRLFMICLDITKKISLSKKF